MKLYKYNVSYSFNKGYIRPSTNLDSRSISMPMIPDQVGVYLNDREISMTFDTLLRWGITLIF